jgi:hypothetical protein
MRTRHLATLTCALLALTLPPSRAGAELLAVESFDYETHGQPGRPTKDGGVNGAGAMPKPLKHLAGGRGWEAGGSWVMTAGNPDGNVNIAGAFEVQPPRFNPTGGTLMLYRTAVQRRLARAMVVDRPLYLAFIHLDGGMYTSPRGLELKSGQTTTLALLAKSKKDGGAWQLKAGDQTHDIPGLVGTDLESVWVLKLEPAGDQTKVSVARLSAETADLTQEPAITSAIPAPGSTSCVSPTASRT